MPRALFDLIGLNARVKFIVQVITACALPLCGLYVNNLYGFMGIHEMPYWLGFILGFLFVKSAMHNPPLMSASPARFVLAYSLLIVPVFDVVRVILHRLRIRQPLFNADKNHIHHKLMRLGMTQHQALIFILGLAVAYVALNLLLFPAVSITCIVLIDVATFTFIQLLLTRKAERKKMKIAT